MAPPTPPTSKDGGKEIAQTPSSLATPTVPTSVASSSQPGGGKPTSVVTTTSTIATTPQAPVQKPSYEYLVKYLLETLDAKKKQAKELQELTQENENLKRELKTLSLPSKGPVRKNTTEVPAMGALSSP
jgi:hypothetical protein